MCIFLQANSIQLRALPALFQVKNPQSRLASHALLDNPIGLRRIPRTTGKDFACLRQFHAGLTD